MEDNELDNLEEEAKTSSAGLFLGLTDEEICERVDTEYNNGYEFKKPAVLEWQENENILYGKKPKTLSKRSNISLQLMAGFEDTLLSKIKQPIFVVYTATESADINKARKVTSAWQLESSVSHEDWEYKDLLVKKLAMVSGRGITKIRSNTPYAHKLDPIDHYDFIVDPLTNGMSLESARYLGQDNIIKAKWELEAGDYDQSKVKELIESYSDKNAPVPDNIDLQKSYRFSILNLNYNDYFQAGDPSYRLLEWYTTIKGQRVVLLLDKDKKIIIKKKLLSDVTGSLKDGEQPFWPYESWAYYPDLFNFWSPSPMSRVREIMQLRNVSLNQMFDNNEAKNKPMKAYDPKVYTNPSLFTYSPDRPIPVAPGRDPSKGLFLFPASDIIEPRIFDEILEKLAGKITGVTASGAGISDTEKVGIYYGDQQEIEKRMTLFEISYNRAHLRLGQKYLKYLSERLTKDTSIKILGEDGVEYEDLTQDDLADFDITITGGLSQAANDALEKKSKNEFLKSLIGAPIANQKFVAELGLALNGFNKDEIKGVLAPVDVDEKQLVRASEDVQKILLGKKFKPFLKAEIPYMQRIFDYVYETDLSRSDEDKLMTYLAEIQPIVIQNMMNKARSAMAMRGMLQLPEEFMQQQMQPTDNQNIETQNGLDQQRAQEIPSETQQMYER